MPPENRDAAYLWDMLDAARTIQEFTTNVSLENYLIDRKLQLAVERLIEIVGEAARLVSDELKADHPEIPWRLVVAQRNVLAHDYGEILQDRIWRVATDRIPELVQDLQRLLPAPENGQLAAHDGRSGSEPSFSVNWRNWRKGVEGG